MNENEDEETGTGVPVNWRPILRMHIDYFLSSGKWMLPKGWKIVVPEDEEGVNK